MKTCLFKYIENFTTKNWNFSDKNSDIFIFLLKTYYIGTRKNRLAEAVLTSTHNLCFREEIKKITYTPVNQSFVI